MIADGAVAIIGGRNIGDEYFEIGETFYVDMDALAVGQIVPQTAATCDAYWNSASAFAVEDIISGTGDRAAFDARVSQIRSSPEAGVLVTSIITLAHNLKMRVVAEGVELRDQLVYLKTAGCDAAQGYILSRPVPAQETQRLLRQGILEPA